MILWSPMSYPVAIDTWISPHGWEIQIFLRRRT
jgi:hypothetical protein